MAGTGGLEIIREASQLIATVCRSNGCIYARTREGYAEDEAPWDCSVLYEDHVVENLNGDGCQSAAISNPSRNPGEFGTVIPGTMTMEGFTKHDGRAPLLRENHRVEVMGFPIYPSPPLPE